jgi:hypothetical protein
LNALLVLKHQLIVCGMFIPSQNVIKKEVIFKLSLLALSLLGLALNSVDLTPN